ncbi:hypothetical protein K493DRAFT_58783 [Basidiobolus meristosporus CBS 931.73]|uniref:PH domain-containing protein n=1 Tax=Basidiobolus meristosporus CBS 931.73 TaxID=1314790 RepID=A0A1Y1XXL3_9FUNG|nr:hypothetical protein K493DRAFT_58783 [Basidiobolus meristosporus CBS 931.73]|eukprot:ORX90478.1 hypothetical protein K493DRAFT_58783 [Basidiobolus meristosporus CBS 931.73]
MANSETAAPLSKSFQKNHDGTLQNLYRLFSRFAEVTDSFDIRSPVSRWYMLAIVCQWYVDKGHLSEEELERYFHKVSRDMSGILKISPRTTEPSTSITEQARLVLKKMEGLESGVLPPLGHESFMFKLKCLSNGHDQPYSRYQAQMTLRRRGSLNEAHISRGEEAGNNVVRGHQRSSSWPNSPMFTAIKPPSYESLTECLPKYSCSVHYEGYLHRKMEFNEHGDLASDRSWRKLYFVLWGTSLRLYKYKPTQLYHGSVS